MSRLVRDGTAEPVSRGQMLRREGTRKNRTFPVPMTTSTISNHTRLIGTLLNMLKIDDIIGSDIFRQKV